MVTAAQIEAIKMKLVGVQAEILSGHGTPSKRRSVECYKCALRLARRGTNPRWVACLLALGRPFRAGEFMLWNGERWQEFAKERGIRIPGETAASACELKLGIGEAHKQYDSWLLQKVLGERTA